MNVVRLAFMCFILFFSFILYRLFIIQIAKSEQYIPLEKYLKVERILSLRGDITDMQGVPLAVNKRVFDVYIDTKKVEKNDRLIKELQRELKISEATMSAYLEKKNWQKIASRVDSNVKNKIEKYYPEYLNLEESWTRDYPEGSRAAHLLGFVGRNDIGNPQGYIGVEGYFEQELRGLPSVKEQESDVRGISLIGGASNKSSGTTGVTVQLTIDSTVQSIMEEELAKGVEKFQAKHGCGIIMDSETSEIRAMGCVPSFDPEKYYEATPEAFVNQLVSTVYEPGSTFKPLIVAMAVEQKKVKPDTIFDESGPLQVGEYAIRTWNNAYRGKITAQKTLEQSSNVGMVHIINTMDKKIVGSYLDRLGFMDQTGVELQGEALPLIRSSNEWRPIDYATLSFGQGIAITPMQLITAFASLSNDGYYRKPTLIGALKQGNEVIQQGDGAQKTRIFSKQTVNTMQQMLNSAVEKSEAQYPQKPDGYRFCGKTGTAQIPIAGHYDPSKTIASFIGFYPCNGNKPKLLMLILYREPTGSIYGSETAAPTFFSIAKRLLVYYNVAP